MPFESTKDRISIKRKASLGSVITQDKQLNTESQIRGKDRDSPEYGRCMDMIAFPTKLQYPDHLQRAICEDVTQIPPVIKAVTAYMKTSSRHDIYCNGLRSFLEEIAFLFENRDAHENECNRFRENDYMFESNFNRLKVMTGENDETKLSSYNILLHDSAFILYIIILHICSTKSLRSNETMKAISNVKKIADFVLANIAPKEKLIKNKTLHVLLSLYGVIYFMQREFNEAFIFFNIVKKVIQKTVKTIVHLENAELFLGIIENDMHQSIKGIPKRNEHHANEVSNGDIICVSSRTNNTSSKPRTKSGSSIVSSPPCPIAITCETSSSEEELKRNPLRITPHSSSVYHVKSLDYIASSTETDTFSDFDRFCCSFSGNPEPRKDTEQRLETDPKLHELHKNNKTKIHLRQKRDKAEIKRICDHHLAEIELTLKTQVIAKEKSLNFEAVDIEHCLDRAKEQISEIKDQMPIVCDYLTMELTLVMSVYYFRSAQMAAITNHVTTCRYCINMSLLYAEIAEIYNNTYSCKQKGETIAHYYQCINDAARKFQENYDCRMLLA